jgi:hypothetical protein
VLNDSALSAARENDNPSATGAARPGAPGRAAERQSEFICVVQFFIIVVQLPNCRELDVEP